jgi:hypothetical protein
MLLASGLLSLLSSPAFAGCDPDELGAELAGYTLIVEKRVQGEFNGCNFGNLIVFQDNTAVRCMGYSYHYAYRPEAYLFGNGSDYEMCVNGNLFRIQP